MKRVVFAAVILGALVVGLNTGFVHWDPAVATTVPPCQFLGINDSGTTINTTIPCVTPIASGGGVVTVKATATSCGQPVQPSPTAGAVVVEVPVCATSAPQNTASPTATSTSTAGAPSLVVSGSFPYTLAANFPVAGAAAGGFPWALRQAGNFCASASAGTSIVCTYGSTPTTGDFLLALASYSCNSAGTITTPSGWSIVEGPECNSAMGLIIYDKSSAGTESTVTFTESNTSGQTGYIYDFNGARTVDKVAEGGGTAQLYLATALSSPTSGAGVIVLCGGIGASTGPIPELLALTNVTNDWGIAPLQSTEYLTSVAGFWQNKVGTGTLDYPYCVNGTSGVPQSVITMSLL